jgi:hypothetical protein
LPTPGGPLQEDRLAVAHPGAGGERVDARALDRRLEGEIEGLERLADRQVRDLERGLHPPLLPAGQLRREQPVEEGVRRDLAAHRLAQQGPELLGGVAAAERQQPVPGRVDVEPRLRRAHRAASASAA